MVLDLLNKELKQYSKKQIENTLGLLAEGNTIPFIARYRKELTGSLDEVQIKEISDRHQYLENLENRKEEIIRLISEQGKMTEALQAEILKADKLNQLEDLYRPYRPKRRTKAVMAREKGLEPLAEYILSMPLEGDIDAVAQKFVSDEVPSIEAALAGAHEIMAEIFGDEPEYRRFIRAYTFKNGIVSSAISKGELDEKKVYEMYYDFKEPLNRIANHRVLAMNRAEKEGVIKVEIVIDEAPIFAYLGKSIIGNRFKSISTPFVMKAYEDAYRRFIKPSIERELRNELSEKAETQAISVFGDNLRNLLLQAPLKNRVVMGFDPAYRTGCKLGIVDETGKVLHVDTIYPHPPASKERQAAALKTFVSLIKKYKVEMVAIGNGTASRESEQFVADALKSLDEKVYYLIVNEAGASVYSASEIAREEFPDLQVEQRSAISIARRVQDP
ncbi:MAG TPA: Tex-like N-terminal domain-containing protein, partial [Erysipelothrix sp.]|nr:Tex-like N-terminal domain-containing protein [Erysipelothrix sp.]